LEDRLVGFDQDRDLIKRGGEGRKGREEGENERVGGGGNDDEEERAKTHERHIRVE
jgi:hypothetical protein